jgi:hypothetical protein
MTLRDLLAERQPALSERWLDAIFADYGEEAAATWRRERDRFANPFGHVLKTELPQLVRAINGDGELAAAAPALEAIIRIRSVQDLAPSRAVAFVYSLRDVIRAELAAELADAALAAELAGLERRIERLALLAFDVYVRCRDQVFRLRNDELKRSVAALLRRWNGGELPEPAPVPPRRGTSPRPATLPILTGER